MKKKLIAMLVLVLVLVPFVALAQTTGDINPCPANYKVTDVETFLCKVGDILTTVIPILIILGVVYFIWGVISYVIAGDEEAKKTGRDRIIMGIIGLAVIVGVWGLVQILKNTFNISGSQKVDFPTTPY